LCGAAEGFPEALAKRASLRISLSPLTFSHELARVMLAEQIYRAFAILSGHPYPK
jgi:23S rRNA (pseudouridine1915-N3)-methyltransferase